MKIKNKYLSTFLFENGSLSRLIQDRFRRKLHIDFWTELLLSASQQLIEAKYIGTETVELATKELKTIARDPNAIFYYSFMSEWIRT